MLTAKVFCCIFLGIPSICGLRISTSLEARKVGSQLEQQPWPPVDGDCSLQFSNIIFRKQPFSSFAGIFNTAAGRGWIDTGGIRRGEVGGVVAAVVVWFIAGGRSAKDCWDRPFLFSYIYRVRKAAT